MKFAKTPWMKAAALSAISIIGIGFTNTVYEADHFQQKVSTSVISHLNKKSNANVPVLIVLKKQANVKAATSVTTEEKLSAKEFRKLKLRKAHHALTSVASSTQGPIVDFLKSKGVKYRQFYIHNMIAVYGASANLLMELSARDDVKYIRGNFPFKVKIPAPEKQILEAQTAVKQKVQASIGENIKSTGADRVWSELGVTGENIVIAGQDTGVQWDHPALYSHYRGFSPTDGSVDHNYNWHDAIHEPLSDSANNICGYDLDAPCDDSDHGTHTIGTVVGDDGDGNQIGMAPGAVWMACRNMDDGVGAPATYIECFEYFLAPYQFGGNPFTDGEPNLAPHVINNSWGCPKSEGCEGEEFLPIMEDLESAGIMIVASAGNEGSGCATIQDPPAWHSDVTLSVGAHDSNGKIAYFSSRGPSLFDGGIGPDVTAPGVNIRSAIPGSKYAQFGWSGTSMAGPHVVGLVALMWSANPELVGNIALTSDLIRNTATPKTTDENCGGVSGSEIPNNTYGYGLINAYEAVKASL